MILWLGTYCTGESGYRYEASLHTNLISRRNQVLLCDNVSIILSSLIGEKDGGDHKIGNT